MNENETDNVWRCNQSTYSFRIYLWLSAADWTHEQNARVAGDSWYWNWTASNYKALSVPHCLMLLKMSQHRTFSRSAVFYTFIYHTSSKFLQADGGLPLHATLSYSVCDVIWYKVTWLPTNLTAFHSKTSNICVISTDWSHFWYSASSCYVLRKCVILRCVIQLAVTGLTVDIIKLNN